MALQNMYVVEEDGEQCLKFVFDEGMLTFECPIGMSAQESIAAFKEFIATAEDVVIFGSTIH